MIEATKEELLALVVKAAEIAGEKITKKTLPQSHIDNIVSMLIRDHHNTSWMTTDERKAFEIDLSHRDYTIESLQKELGRVQKGLQEFQQSLDVYEVRVHYGIRGDTVTHLKKFCSELLNIDNDDTFTDEEGWGEY